MSKTKNSLIVLSTFFLFANAAQAAKTLTNFCLEKTSVEIINFLTEKDSSADLHLVKSESDRVVGLIDTTRTFPTFDLTDIRQTTPSVYVVTMSANEYFVKAEVETRTPSNKPTCKVTTVFDGTEVDE